MTSPLLALFTRSLREDARSKATFWTRAGVSGFILLMLSGFAMNDNWAGAPGKIFFGWIVILQMMSITMLGLSYFASAVTEEKEEQTLGLLRMTNLSPLSILLGKSTSRLCGALLILAAGFPFTVFAVTLGGVSLGQILAAYGTVAAYTFLLCNVALLGSVVARNTPRAAAFSVAVLILWVGAAPLLRWLSGKLPPTGFSSGLHSLGTSLWEATPIARLIEVFMTGFSGSPITWQVESNLAAGVVFFLVGWAVFHRFCDRVSEDTGPQGALVLPGFKRRRPPRPVSNAVTWKEYYYSCGGRRGIIVRTIFYGGLLATGVIDFVTNSRTGFGLGYVLGSMITFIFSIDIAAMAVRMFRAELNDQTLSVLATLPCTLRQIAWRKARACVLAAIPGALSVFGGIVLTTSHFNRMVGGITMEPMRYAQLLDGAVTLFLLVHLAVALSLVMKRGALPLSYILTHVFHGVVSALGMMLFSFGLRVANISNMYYLGPLLAAFSCVLLALILHRRIPKRLEALAGEG
jgi:hypothetical protein